MTHTLSKSRLSDGIGGVGLSKCLLRDPVAVVAIGCRLPTDIVTPDSFWDILIKGKSQVSEVPETWIDSEVYFDPQPGKTGKTYSKLGTIFDNTQIETEIKKYPFHPKFRNDNPILKLAYIVAEEVKQQAGITADNRDYGIYVGGIRASDFSDDYILSTTVDVAFESLNELPEFGILPADIQRDIIRRSTDAAIRNLRNDKLSANYSPEIRLGDFVTNLREIFGWTGAAYSLDAACASSLVAIDCARNDILSGKIDGALVGGISAMTKLTPILFSKNFAATGKLSRPFDANADGMVGSMGIVFTFLKSLKQAKIDGNSILGLIRGIGFSSDGRGKSLWAPRPEGELLAMQRAYNETQITPHQLSYIEAHATSTNVGDSTELKVIEKLLNDSSPNQNNNTPQNKSADKYLPTKKLAIGSVKANIGHSFEAAGLIGLMKVLQICKNKIVPAQINISELHPDILNRDLPFFIPLENYPLETRDNVPHLFGINAFGVGGLNTHLILEEYSDEYSEKYIGTDAAEDDTNVDKKNVDVDVDSRREAGRILEDCDEAGRIPIAVVGVGCVYAGAFSTNSFSDILNANIDPKCSLSSFELRRRFFSDKANSNSADFQGGFIENYFYDWERHKIPPLQIQRCDPLQTYVMGAVDEAMNAAIVGRELTDDERDNTFVVAGSDHFSNFFNEYLLSIRAHELAKIVRQNTKSIFHEHDFLNTQKERFGLTDETADMIAANFAKKIIKDNPCISDVTGSFSSSSLASRITKIYDLHGGAFTIDGGSTSSIIALDYSLQKLRRENVSYGICIGAYRWTNSHASEYYSSKHNAEAFPLAEGAGSVILKPLPQVNYRYEKPLGIICDIIKVSQGVPDKSEWESLALCVDDLLFVAIASPTPAKHLKNTASFFHNLNRSNPIPITTCRYQFGNLCNGAGMAELIKTLLILQNRIIPPQSDWTESHQNSELFFVTKNPINLEYNNSSFAILFDIDANGDGYAAIILPDKFALNNRVLTIGFEPRQITLPNPLRLFDDESTSPNSMQSDSNTPNSHEHESNETTTNMTESIHVNLLKPDLLKPVYFYRQTGAAYDMGFGLGVADSHGIVKLMNAYRRLQTSTLESIGVDLNLLSCDELFGDGGLDELRGLADGSGVSFEELFEHNFRFYSGLTGEQFLLRDAGQFWHVVIFEHSLCADFKGIIDIHLSECEPATSGSYLRISATGCIGGFAASNKTDSSISILSGQNKSHLSTIKSMTLHRRLDMTSGNQSDKSISQIDSTANQILIVNTSTGKVITNSKNNTPTYDAQTANEIIRKFSSRQNYLCTVMISGNKIQIF